MTREERNRKFKANTKKAHYIVLCVLFAILIGHTGELPARFATVESHAMVWITAVFIAFGCAIAPVFETRKWRYLCYIGAALFSLMLGIVPLLLFVLLAILLWSAARNNKEVFDMVHRLWLPD